MNAADIFLDWALGVGLALLAVVGAALAHDIATEHHHHDREGD